MEGDGKEKRENGKDIWRDSLLRYCGYANELGESFKPVMPKLLLPSYGVSVAYVLGDTLDKYKKAALEAEAMPVGVRTLHKSEAILDTFVWQISASVVIPGFIINRLVKVAQFGIKRLPRTPAAVVTWAPTVLGLSVIPIIIHPVDHFVDWVMDNTIRPKLRDYKDSKF
eukprot:g3823.t1